MAHFRRWCPGDEAIVPNGTRGLFSDLIAPPRPSFVRSGGPRFVGPERATAEEAQEDIKAHIRSIPAHNDALGRPGGVQPVHAAPLLEEEPATWLQLDVMKERDAASA